MSLKPPGATWQGCALHPGLLNVLQGKGVVEAQLGLGRLRMEALNSLGARGAGAIGRQHWVGSCLWLLALFSQWGTLGGDQRVG